ncbi:anaphase-promoting complex subunit cdc27 [Kappamyces sp. JEL0829]|nr:anaphase-promoting complex subunit cdc27 [Kappamyces sp. JEL0829]
MDFHELNSFSILIPAIQSAIDSFQYHNALFLAERATAIDPSPSTGVEALFLLAKTHYLLGNKKQCKAILEGLVSSSGPCVLLFATCCLELNHLQEGQHALRTWLEHHQTNNDVLVKASIYCLLGRIHRQVGRLKDARDALVKCLELDPINWTAFCMLADIGTLALLNLGYPANTFDYLDTPKLVTSRQPKAAGATAEKTSKPAKSLMHESIPKRRAIEPRVLKGARAPLAATTLAKSSEEARLKRTREAAAGQQSATLEKKALPDSQSQQLSSQNCTIGEFVSVMQKIINAYVSLAMCRGKPTLDLIGIIPLKQYETSLVLTLAAKAHFELHQYQQSADLFKQIRQVRLDPYRMEGMDYYGTCLWHLNRKVELNSLGKELEEIDKQSPQTWYASGGADSRCVVGNYYSLMQEHDSAIQAFRKAVQIDPLFTYAHTLMGHEYLSNEDLEAAAKSFKAAVQSHHRHYNAIFGLGLVERKQEKYNLAEYYFRKALEITPNNPILLDSLASVIQKDESRLEDALDIYDRVIQLAPEQRIYSLHRAQLLFSMQQYRMVIQILENEVRNSKPESSVYFLLGKTYAMTGEIQQAIMAMTLAQDYLEHKSSSIIKDAIEKLFLCKDGMDSSFQI